MVAAHQRKKTGTKKIPAELSRVEVPHDTAEEEKVCPHDGTALARIGEETLEQYEFMPPECRCSSTSDTSTAASAAGRE